VTKLTDSQSVTNQEAPVVRTAKDPEKRRQELMEAALELFLEQGTERTAVSHIVKRVGVAQGTFYYHFDSKDDLVDAVARQVASPLGELIGGIVEDDSQPVPARLRTAISTLLDVIAASQAHLEGLIRPGNERLHQLVADAMRARLHPLFTSLVEEGNADGSLAVEPAAETVELVLAAVTHLTRTQAHGESGERMARLRTAVTQLASRTLGIETIR